MKVVYSLLAAFVVGGILIPIAMAQYPNSSVPRYPTMSSTPATTNSANATSSNSPYVVAQTVPSTTPTPKLAVPSSNSTAPTTNTTRIVTEQGRIAIPPTPLTSSNPTIPAPRGAEPLPVQEPIAGFPIAIAPTQHVPLSLGALQPTPEMWFYEQMRQDYNNPALQVRRNSERAAQERKARLASMEWYGMSNSRPMAYTTPHMYHYSPTWSSGNRRSWFWTGSSSTTVNVDARRVNTLGVSGIGTW